MKAALSGEEVIIASHGKPQVKLVPCAAAAGLKQPGGLAALSSNTAQLDDAFCEAVDQQVAELFNGDRFAQARVEGLMAVSSDGHWPGYDVSLHRA